MPKPKPLNNLSSAVYTIDPDNQTLTPRTPRSRFERHGAAEEQYDDLDLHVTSEQQTVPLLSSGPDEDDHSQRSKSQFKSQRLRSVTSCLDIPLIGGTLLACFLFALIIFSYKNPERLQEYVGAKAPSAEGPSPSEGHIYTPPPEVPLHPSEYVAQCKELNKGFMSHGDYWDKMQMGTMGLNITDEADEEVDEKYNLPEGGRTTICTKTITYLLDGEVGLLADLALIAQAAALARERNRTFIINDVYWNRGRWTDHFQGHLDPGPEPGCRAPHPKDLAPCPRTARHWVITAHTVKYHFGHSFLDHYEDPYAHQLNRLRPIYNAASTSFISTIRPNAELGALIRSTRRELMESIALGDSYLAVHIRRGDRKLSSSAFDGQYVPISEYTTAVETTRGRLASTSTPSTVYLASDSPAAEQEFADAYPGHFFSLRQSVDSGIRELASNQEYDQEKFNELSEEERVRLTTGMVVDFALLSGMWVWEDDPVPAASICTISSNICKMMAVGLGWEKAFGQVNEMGDLDETQNGWVDVEEKGKVVPVWNAFRLF